MASAASQNLTWAQVVARPAPRPETRPPPAAPVAPPSTQVSAQPTRTRAEHTHRPYTGYRPHQSRTQPSTAAAIRLARQRQRQEGNLFLRLPGELRNQIYDYLLTQEEPVVALQRANVGSQASGWKTTQPALSFTCKLLREEVLGVWVAANAFVICPEQFKWVQKNDVGAWARSLGPHIQSLNRIGCLWHGDKIAHGRFISRPITLMATLTDGPPSLPPPPPRPHIVIYIPLSLPPHNSTLISASGGGDRYGFATCAVTGESITISIDDDIEDLCDCVLQLCAEGFVTRCKGRGFRREVAVVDLADLLCNKLAVIESRPYREKCGICSGLGWGSWARFRWPEVRDRVVPSPKT